MLTDNRKSVKRISSEPLKGSCKFFQSKTMILSNMFVNFLVKKITLSTRNKLKRMSPRMSSILWMKSKRKVNNKRLKKLITLISKKLLKKMPTSSWVDVWSVLLIQSSSLNKSSVDGLRTSSQSKDLWKNMKRKSNNLIRKSDFLKMTSKWESKRKHNKSQNFKLKKNQHLIFQKRRKSTRSSITQDIAKTKKAHINQCSSNQFHLKTSEKIWSNKSTISSWNSCSAVLPYILKLVFQPSIWIRSNNWPHKIS